MIRTQHKILVLNKFSDTSVSIILKYLKHVFKTKMLCRVLEMSNTYSTAMKFWQTI